MKDGDKIISSSEEQKVGDSDEGRTVLSASPDKQADILTTDVDDFDPVEFRLNPEVSNAEKDAIDDIEDYVKEVSDSDNLQTGLDIRTDDDNNIVSIKLSEAGKYIDILAWIKKIVSDHYPDCNFSVVRVENEGETNFWIGEEDVDNTSQNSHDNDSIGVDIYYSQEQDNDHNKFLVFLFHEIAHLYRLGY